MNIVRCSWLKKRKTAFLDKNCRFPCKIALRLKKVWYKVSLCENCQRRSYKAFIRLSVGVEMIGGRPLLRKDVLEAHPYPLAKNDFHYIFALSASAVSPSEKSSINTNRKLHTGFRLVPTSMSFNDLELRNSPYFAFFHRM